MYCGNCGHQVDDGTTFCPYCGAKQTEETVGNQYARGNSYGSGSSNNDDMPNVKGFLTNENIERFAPLAVVLPIGMAILLWIFAAVFGNVFFTLYRITRISAPLLVLRAIYNILKIVFVVAAGGATAGLVYIAVRFKNMSNPFTWVAPAATFIATLSCIGFAFGWTIFAWIMAIIALVAGIELIARIVIAKQPMDSPVNPDATFSTYSEAARTYKANNPTTKDLERAGIADPENSYFDGAGVELLGYIVLTFLVCAVTCGIAAPWMICNVYKWQVSHTVINGKRLTFTGNGGSLLGHWILWYLLTAITCGIYGFFMHVALRKWELQRTFIEGEPMIPGTGSSDFDGGTVAYIGYSILAGFLQIITLGLATPWTVAMLTRWDTKHQVINNRRLAFSGSGLGFLGEYIIIFLLTLITCGIYAPWGIVRMNKFIIRHTDFVN